MRLNELHQLFSYPNVHTVGEGIKQVGGRDTGLWSAIAFVDRKLEVDALAASDVIPRTIRDSAGREVLTDVVEKGRFYALQGSGPTPSAPQHRVRIRPVVAGISTSVYSKAGTGTICSLQVRDKVTGRRVGISNNHVWAAVNGVPIGTLEQQPGVVDQQAIPDLEIGKLLRYVPLKLIQASARPPGAPPENLWNWCDLALMDFMLADNQYAYETLELGNIPGTKVITGNEIALPKDQKACKISSRTSGLPSTYPTAVNVSSWIFYTTQMVGFFVMNVMTPDGSVQPGDSGSPLIWMNGKLLAGLTYAGTQQGAGLHNSIDQVLEKGQLEYLPGPGAGPGKKYGPAAAMARYVVSTEGTSNAKINLVLNKELFLPGETVIATGGLMDTDTKEGLPGKSLDWEDQLIAMVPVAIGSVITGSLGDFEIRFPAGVAGNHVLAVRFKGDP